MIKSAFVGAATVAAAIALVPSAASAQCVGTCGVRAGTDGVVTGPHSWVVTGDGFIFDGPANPGLGLGSETDGSTFTTSPFVANGTDILKFEFNYVTSDGAGFSDYAWVELLGSSSSLILFTARTTTSGDTVPGFGLPGLAPGVVLTPAATPIIAGAPVWSPLGRVSSGDCYDLGCGYTGWIEMAYTPVADTYRLRFGVVNWVDTDFESGLAWRGTVIGVTPIDPIPEPGTWAMLIAGFGLVGAAARRRRMAVAA